METAAAETAAAAETVAAVAPVLSWPELVRYDGGMVARAIQHDRPDVRVVTVTEAQTTDGEFAELLAQQTWDGWEERAAPLFQEESATM